MEIHIDLIPPKEGYFISVELSEKESLAFDNTWVGHGIRKQVLVGQRYPNKEPDGKWVTLKVIDGEPKGRREVEWVDEGEIAVINNNAWKTVEVIDLPEEIDEKLMDISSRIYMNREDLESVKKDLEKLDRIISERKDEVLEKFSE